MMTKSQQLALATLLVVLVVAVLVTWTGGRKVPFQAEEQPSVADLQFSGKVTKIEGNSFDLFIETNSGSITYKVLVTSTTEVFQVAPEMKQATAADIGVGDEVTVTPRALPSGKTFEAVYIDLINY